MNKMFSCSCDSWYHTAYDVRYSCNLSNQFRLQVEEWLVCTIQFNGYSLWMHPNSIYSRVT